MNLDELKKLAWTGIPSSKYLSNQITLLLYTGNPNLRAEVWRFLSDYIPVDQELREDTLKRKRSEYGNLVKHYFTQASPEDTVEQLGGQIEEMSAYEIKTFKQIRVDVHRT